MNLLRLKSNRQQECHWSTVRKQSHRSLHVEMLEERRVLATITVSIIGDAGGDGTLRAAIEQANLMPGADEIVFDGSLFNTPRMLRLFGGELEITESLTITGPGPDWLVIDAMFRSRILHYSEASGNLTVHGLTMTKGRTDEGNGGALRFASNDSLIINNCVITDSVSTAVNGDGGGISAGEGVSQSEIHILNSTIRGNRTTGRGSDGGGISGAFNATLSVTNSTISNNSTSADYANGGGVNIGGRGSIRFQNSIVSGNSTRGKTSRGGGIYSWGGRVYLDTTTVEGNSTLGPISGGGGIGTGSGAVYLNGSTVHENSTSGNEASGGGIDASTVQLIHSSVRDNQTVGRSSDGGGINATYCQVHVESSTVAGNRATGNSSNGGGIYCGPAPPRSSQRVRIIASTISGNTTTGGGGGIGIFDGDVVVRNSTISGNTAGGNGGAIYKRETSSNIYYYNATVSVTNSTIANNSAGGMTGGLYFDNLAYEESPIVIRNSIVAGNSDSGGRPDLMQTPSLGEFSVDYSLIGVVDGLTFSGNDNLTGTLEIPLSPRLLPLADNGGPTLTALPSATSPAIDAGEPNYAGEQFDQRGVGFLRLIDGDFDGIARIDIGATEASLSNQFDPAPNGLASGSANDDVDLADLDGDGDLDAFLTDRDGGEQVWLNNGIGEFTRTNQSLGSSFSVYAELADIDNDGDIDSVVAAGGTIDVWLNDGFANFIEGPSIAVADAQDIALADMNADGAVDIFVAQVADNPDLLFLNSGSGAFFDSGQSLGNGSSRGVEAADIDNDGDNDIIVAVAGSPMTAGNLIWINDGTGQLQSNGQILGDTLDNHLAVGDIDGDNSVDLVSTSGTIWLNDGSGQFMESPNSIIPDSTSHVALGDFDFDGDLDVFQANWSDQPDRVWKNNGEGEFEVFGTGMGAEVSSHVALGDIDDDGDLDAVVATADAGQESRIWLNSTQPLDLDGNTVLDADDIDLMCLAVANNSANAAFDIDRNGRVDPNDFETFLDFFDTIPGDANLSGVVDVTDFNVWNNAKFTSNDPEIIGVGWETADFNCDGATDVADFNIWNDNKFTNVQSGSLPVLQMTPEEVVADSFMPTQCIFNDDQIVDVSDFNLWNLNKFNQSSLIVFDQLNSPAARVQQNQMRRDLAGDLQSSLKMNGFIGDDAEKYRSTEIDFVMMTFADDEFRADF